MGRCRGKTPLQPINNEKTCRLTFTKRKKGLKKKLFELSTLCGIQACILCYGPDGHVETWPEEDSNVHMIIQRYNKVDEVERKKRRETVSSVMLAKMKKLEEQIQNARSGKCRLDKLSQDQLSDLVQDLNTKLEKIRERAEDLRMNQSALQGQRFVRNESNQQNHLALANPPGDFTTENKIFFDQSGMAWVFNSRSGMSPLTDPSSGHQYQSTMPPPQAMPLQGIAQPPLQVFQPQSGDVSGTYQFSNGLDQLIPPQRTQAMSLQGIQQAQPEDEFGHYQFSNE